MSLILGIDPSNTRHAWALMEDETLIGFGRDLTFDEDSPNFDTVDMIAIEMIASYGMAVGAHTFDTCVEIGVLMHQIAMISPRAPLLRRITRVETKRIVCRSVAANDANVRTAIIDHFGGPASIKKGGPLYKVSKDTWAAIAVALAAGSGEAKWYTPVADKEILE